MILWLGDENRRGCYRAISGENFQVEPWVLPLTRGAIYRPFLSSVVFQYGRSLLLKIYASGGPWPLRIHLIHCRNTLASSRDTAVIDFGS